MTLLYLKVKTHIEMSPSKGILKIMNTTIKLSVSSVLLAGFMTGCSQQQFQGGGQQIAGGSQVAGGQQIAGGSQVAGGQQVSGGSQVAGGQQLAGGQQVSGQQ